MDGMHIVFFTVFLRRLRQRGRACPRCGRSAACVFALLFVPGFVI